MGVQRSNRTKMAECGTPYGIRSGADDNASPIRQLIQTQSVDFFSRCSYSETLFLIFKFADQPHATVFFWCAELHRSINLLNRRMNPRVVTQPQTMSSRI